MVFFNFISPFLIGTAILVIIFPRNCFKGLFIPLTICLGAGIGFGITSSLVFFWLTFFGQPTFHYFIGEFIFAMFLSIIAYYQFIARKKTGITPIIVSDADYKPVSWLRYIYYFLLVVSVASFAIKTFGIDPHGIYDAKAIWNFRARWLFRGGIQWDYIFSSELASTHPDYPMLLPISIFRFWRILGNDTVAVPILFAGFFTFGSILLIFASIAILRSLNQGYIAAIFMLLTTQFLNLGTYQYADIPLAFFILSAIVLLSFKDRYPQAALQIMFLVGLSASCAAWTKNEGLLFLILVTFNILDNLLIFDFRKFSKEFFSFLLGLAPIFYTLLFFKLKYAPPNDIVNLKNLSYIWNCLFEYNRYLQVFLEFSKSIIFYNDGIVILMLIYLIFSGFAKTSFKHRRSLAPITIIALLLVGYFFSYIISPYDLRWHLSSSLRRLIIHILPSCVFVLFYFVKGPEKKQGFIQA